MSERLVWHKEGIREVVDLFLFCKKREEIELIFDRVLTPREINDIARRFKALSMIDEGKSYVDIRLATGMSPVTVARLSTKCGFGFQKSSGLRSKSKPKSQPMRKSAIRYKGVRVR